MSLTFKDVCELLHSVETVSQLKPRLPPEKAKAKIDRSIGTWFSKYRAVVDDPATSGSVFLSMLFPHRRKDRVYGLQPHSLAKKIAKLLNFNHGQKALFDEWVHGTRGDIGVYIEDAMRPWNGTFREKCPIEIDRVDRLLTQLAAKVRFSDPAIKRQREQHYNVDLEFKNILVRLDAREAKWLARLVLREYCTINLDERLIFEKYHFLLPDLLMFQNDFEAAMNMLQGDLSCYPPVPSEKLKGAMRLEAAKRLKAVVGIKVGRPSFQKAWSLKHCFQLTNDGAWAAEVKYDGEYCEIHVDMNQTPHDIQIFSKNGKDATADRRSLKEIIRRALRIGKSSCMFQRSCVLLGEMVLYSDQAQTILPFSKIRKHISRSGSFMGAWQDSLPHKWEHLMIVFFDVLAVDDTATLRYNLQERRRILRRLVATIPGRSMRSEWTLLDFKTLDGITDLKQAFAFSIARRQEGLILKPLHAPYFPFYTGLATREPGYFIKLKKDYLSDMGGERDLGDYAIVGASFDAQMAAKSDIVPLHWTHFHLGSLINKDVVQRRHDNPKKPRFKIVSIVSFDRCISRTDLKYLNVHGRLCEVQVDELGSTEDFDFERSFASGPSMSIAFKKPFVAEILGSGFEKMQNETFEVLRHPRVKRIHLDRSWEDCVTMEDLLRASNEQFKIPDASNLDGHAKDVAILVKQYVQVFGLSQRAILEGDNTQQVTQHTTPRSPTDDRASPGLTPNVTSIDSRDMCISSSPNQRSDSTQGAGTQAPDTLRILVRKDTIERKSSSKSVNSTTPASSAVSASSTTTKRCLKDGLISPPTAKRRRKRSPLDDMETNRSLGSFGFRSEKNAIREITEDLCA